MTTPSYDQSFWEQLWSTTLREHADKVAQRPPNSRVVSELGELRPGRALDAGCGHGSETLWLAARGWHVTAVDFSASALAHGRSMAEAAGPELAARIEWQLANLTSWISDSARFDLVVCVYVHIAGSVGSMVQRLSDAVAPGGTLFLVGHRPVDPLTGAPTAAAKQVQVSVAEAVAVLDLSRWQLIVAEERRRPISGTGVDAVVRARRVQ